MGAVAAVSTVSAWGTDSLVDDGNPRRALKGGKSGKGTYAPTGTASPTMIVKTKSAKSGAALVYAKSKGKGSKSAKSSKTYGTDSSTGTGRMGGKSGKTYAPTVSVAPTLLKSKAKSVGKTAASAGKAAKSGKSAVSES